jgi:hypothetical protein
MTIYIQPKLRIETTAASEKLVEDLTKAIVGQIRVFEGKSTGPGAIYGISRCLRMLHEHFEAGYTEEAKKHLIRLKHETEPRTIREVYSLSRKIDKNDRLFYVEHTDGGVKKLAVDLLGMYEKLKGNDEDVLIIKNHIENNTYFIIKHKENDKSLNEKSYLFT